MLSHHVSSPFAQVETRQAAEHNAASPQFVGRADTPHERAAGRAARAQVSAGARNEEREA